jgi:hypothetical protein
VSESLKAPPTARLPGLAASGPGSLKVGWDSVGESLKVRPTARLPGPLNNRPGSLVVTTAKLPGLRGSELKLSSLMMTTGLLFSGLIA